MMRTFFLLLALMLTACDLKRPAVAVHTYLPPPSASKAPQPLDTRIERFNVAPAFEGKPLVWRMSETRYESDFYNEFLSPPRALLLNRTQEWFHLGDHPNPAARALYVDVLSFYGDRRNSEAVVRARFSLEGSNRFEQEYEEREIFSPVDAEGLVKALGIAYDRVLARAYADLTVQFTGPSKSPAHASKESRK
ncbi:MAG TPA: hypothetical protein VJM53_03300 [Burkholderiales bacterium]|nr:hypothetical protein [Burkholderiales bacterium]